ncbi:MAG: hypothetical protein ACD_45C00169G0001 [uncultured bacterium]|nr:MAG: hypothetical protein ACD_45C00169G0001 [uncultured bacterium]
MDARTSGLLSPQDIPNHYRLQELIEWEWQKVLLRLKKTEPLDNEDLANIGLVFLEKGKFKADQAYKGAEFYFNEALAAEEKADISDREIMAACHYGLATMKRENNACDEALAEFKQALELTESDWLKSNILRNEGLAYLKQEKFALAAEQFSDAIDVVVANEDEELNGSLPALYNYWGLCLARQGLAEDNKKLLEQGEKKLAVAAQLYQNAGRKGVNLNNSHDYQSHCFHRGMILVESVERQFNLIFKLEEAEQLLESALFYRKQNKADGQRIGDVFMLLGRACKASEKLEKAIQHFDDALKEYGTVFGPDAKQMKNALKALQDARAELAVGRGSDIRKTPPISPRLFSSPPVSSVMLENLVPATLSTTSPTPRSPKSPR